MFDIDDIFEFVDPVDTADAVFDGVDKTLDTAEGVFDWIFLGED